jgi:hypothetical protein
VGVEADLALPLRDRRLRAAGRVRGGELEHLRLGRAVLLAGLAGVRVHGEEEAAVGEAGERARFALVGLAAVGDLFPAFVRALEEQPADVVERHAIGERADAAGEDFRADADDAGVAEAPHRAGAVVGGLVAVDFLFDLDDGLPRPGGFGGIEAGGQGDEGHRSKGCHKLSPPG